jgi:hypothetical protein
MITSDNLTKLNTFSLQVNECDFFAEFGKDGIHLYNHFIMYDRDVVKLSQIMTDSQLEILTKIINNWKEGKCNVIK